MTAIGIGEVRAAAEAIQSAVERTPCLHSRTLSQIAGCEVLLKFENLQFTASFEERGALAKLSTLAPAARGRRDRDVGGQPCPGVAYHAERLGIRDVVVLLLGALAPGLPFTLLARRARQKPTC